MLSSVDVNDIKSLRIDVIRPIAPLPQVLSLTVVFVDSLSKIVCASPPTFWLKRIELLFSAVCFPVFPLPLPLDLSFPEVVALAVAGVLLAQGS